LIRSQNWAATVLAVIGRVACGALLQTWKHNAKVCVDGARRLREWIEERPRAELDSQLDVLADRGRANGAAA